MLVLGPVAGGRSLRPRARRGVRPDPTGSGGVQEQYVDQVPGVEAFDLGTDQSFEPWVEPGLPTALQSLSHRQRMAVVLVLAYGWSQREAADVMRVTPDTVRTHLERGLSKLRSSLEVAYD